MGLFSKLASGSLDILTSDRRMTMDFSRLHTYTPPQCAPDNTGYTYSLSSSYSTAALDFEKEHSIAPVFDSPRMSRRSLRRQTTTTTTGLHGDDTLALHGNDGVSADASRNHGVCYASGGSGRRETRTVRGRKQMSSSSTFSQTIIETPRKTLSFSAANTPAGEASSLAEHSLVLGGEGSMLPPSSLEHAGLRKRSSTTTTTTTDGYWGADKNVDHHGSSRVEHSSSSGNGNLGSGSTHVHAKHAHATRNGYICQDCSVHSDRKEALTTHPSSSAIYSSSSSSLAAASAAAALSSSSSSSSSSTIYSGNKSQRSTTGVLGCVSSSCVRVVRRAVSPVVSLVTLLFQNLLWLVSRAASLPGKGVASMRDCARWVVSSSVSRLGLVKQSTLQRIGYRANGYEGKAHSSYCGSMNVKGLVTGEEHLNLNGSLCDDCKGKQHLETHTVVHTHTSRFRRLKGTLWALLAYAGYCLLQPGYCVARAGRALGSGVVVLGQTLGSGVAVLGRTLGSGVVVLGQTLGSGVVVLGRTLGSGVVVLAQGLGSGVTRLARRIVSVLWMLLAAPGKAGKGVLWCVGTGWYQLVSLMSVLNVFILTRVLPRLWKLLLLLLPFLLLLALWWWGPSAATLLALLPTVNLTEWKPASPLAYLPSLAPGPAPLAPPPAPISASTPPPAPLATPATPLEQTPAPPVAQAPVAASPVVVGVDVGRLEKVEAGLAALWQRVEQGERTAEQRHGDARGLFLGLRQQLDERTDRDSLGLWVSGLLESRLALLRGELEEQDATQRAQSAEQQKEQTRSQHSRLAELEVLLQVLSTKTQEVQLRQQEQQQKEELREKEEAAAIPPPPPAPVSVAVGQEDHEALLLEVQRLEAELGHIRHDLQGVLACRGRCEQLDTLQDTVSAQVSAQVKKELLALFYGADQDQDQDGAKGEVPEALLAWLSERYVRGADLQASLAALELSILKNVSLQMEQSRARAVSEAQASTEALMQTHVLQVQAQVESQAAQAKAAQVQAQVQAQAQAQAQAEAQAAQAAAQTVNSCVQHAAVAEGLSEEQVQLIVQNALKLYSYDRTGVVDYALESGGGSILGTRCSETYETKTALMSLFGLPLWYFSQSPRVVIQPDVYPGNCWAFKGSQGYLVIRLSLSVRPTAFCLEHIPKALSPTGAISSAPRNFTVYGLDDEYQEEGKLLGQYTYQDDGDSLQTFPVTEENDRAFQIIEVRVLTNWGHPEYTCLYRFRVHGQPSSQ